MRSKRSGPKRLTYEGVFSFIALFCIFLGALNLINRYYYFIYIAAIVLIVYPGKKFCFDKDFLVLMCFSMSLLIFDVGNQSRVTDMIKPFAFPLCYIMGTSIFISEDSDSLDFEAETKKAFWIIYVIAAGSFMHFLLNMIINRNADDRHVIDYWTRREMSATGQAVLACFIVGVAIAFLFSKVSRKKKLVAVISLLLVVAYNLILAGRTLFVLVFILVGFALLYNSITFKKMNLKILFVIIFAIFVVFLLYSNDILGVKTSFENSNFYNRFFDGSNNQELDDDKRLEHKIAYLKYFLDYPFGGRNIKRLYGHRAHDLYFDTHDSAGIFALISIVIYIGFSLNRMIQCHKSRMLSFESKLLILSIYLITNIQFWLEPIIEGVPWFLAAYCLFDGSVAQLLSKERNCV